MIENRAYMFLIYGLVERGCSLFIQARFTIRFHYWVFISTNLLRPGYIFICINVCFNAFEMINTSFSFIDENVSYELMYIHTLFELL